MPRAVWKGSISFGLVSVPVELFATTQDKSVHFHLMSKDGACRLRQRLYCPETKREYNFGETAKGVEIAPGNYVLLDKEELKALRPESGDAIDITNFINLEEVDPIYFQRSYYLAPTKQSAKAYGLLHQSMKRSGKVALATFVMRQKAYLAVIRPLDRGLCLETMHYQDDLIAFGDIPGMGPKVAASPKELKIADQLIDSMTTRFDPSSFHDEYTQKVKKMVAAKAKAKGKKIVAPAPTAVKTGKVIDLMDALKQSLGARKPATKAKTAPRAGRAPKRKRA